MTAAEPPKVGAPSIFASSLARRILGFGVWFAIGSRPSSERSAYPAHGRDRDVSGHAAELADPALRAVHGMMAVTIEFMSEQRIGKATLTRWFNRATATFGLSLIVMIALYLSR